MRQARALKASAQDVCVFCAFRSTSTSRSSTARRRYFQTKRSLPQQTGAAFKEPEFQFGSLADAVEQERAPPPPPQEPSPAPRQARQPGHETNQGPSIRFQTGGSRFNRGKDVSDFGGDSRRVVNRSVPVYGGEGQRTSTGSIPTLGGESNRTTSRSIPKISGDGQRRAESPWHTKRQERTQSRDLGPRIRFHVHHRDEPGTESTIREDVTNKWQIMRRNREAQNTVSSPPAAAQSIPLRPGQDNAPTPTGEPRNFGSRSLNGNNKYLPFDSRFGNNDTTGADCQPRQSQNPVRTLGSEQRYKGLPRRVDSEPTARQAVESAIAPRRTGSTPWHEASYRGTVGWQPSVEKKDDFRESNELPISTEPATPSLKLGNGYDFETRRDERPSPRRADAVRPRAKDKKAGKYRRDEDLDDRDARSSRKKDKGKRSSKNEDDEGGRFFDVDAYHRKKQQRKKQRDVEEERAEKRAKKRQEREIKLPDFISVGNLAMAMKLRYEQFATTLERLGFEDVNNDFILNAETAALICEDLGFFPVTESEDPNEDIVAAPVPENLEECPSRPPVVTIMGHVDHGKTTILDFLRKSSIVASEHGGITQHIGAFSVPMSSGKNVTFLDTPGHAAFLSMRQRGANVTDIIILVVAADDSVMPQTLEAIKHARAANVPMIVALNKIDKPEADPERVKQDLARHGVDVEGYGGDVQVVEVSGKTGRGMQELEEAIVALSEILDQRAPPDGPVEGWVLESSTKEVGKVATLLIRRGTLRSGDIIVAGTEFCRVRTMRNEFGVPVPEVGPGQPVEVDGWRGQPGAGDEVLQAPDESTASRVCRIRETRLERMDLGKDVQAINETRKIDSRRHERDKAIAKAKKQGLELPEEEVIDAGPGMKKVYFIVKGDVAGSVEAVVNSVSALGNADVQPHILRSGVGPVSEFDIDHANAAQGQVISFNSVVPPSMRAMAERAGIKILDHNIIYRLVDDVKTSLEDVLPPLIKSRVTGEADIAMVFDINVKSRKYMKIAGVKVRNGVIARNSKVRVVRGEDVVFTGSLSSLKNVKKDVVEMAKGTECGMGFDGWEDFQVGDVAQCYEEWEERRKL